MDWNLVSGLVKAYQSGLAGLLGFTGVIVTLIVNASLSRASRRELRQHEAETFRRAILEELAAMAKSVSAARHSLSADSGFDTYPIGWSSANARATQVFEANLQRVGLLSAPEVEAVTRAYKSHYLAWDIIPAFSKEGSKALYVI